MNKRAQQVHEDSSPEVDPDWNEVQLAFMQEIAPSDRPAINLRDADETLAEWDKRFNAYIEACKKYGRKVGNLSCYMALGINKMTVDRIMHGSYAQKLDPRIKLYIEAVKQYCAAYREALGNDGKINPATLIFWQKNYDGLKDVQEQVTIQAQAIEGKSVAELEAKYTNLIVSDNGIKK